MSNDLCFPRVSDFPAGSVFVIKEFDVPLVQTPDGGCFNWFGGKPHPYSQTALRVDNNWRASSFEEWVAVVKESLEGRD
jgi:hypothetical protein